MQDPVIVVGGGLCGLAVAALLAREGVPVEVLERRREPGGRAATLTVDGYALTEGAHALYLGGAAARVLRELGVRPSGNPPDAARGRGLWEGAVVRAPFGAAGLLRSPFLTAGQRAAAGRALAAAALGRPVAPGGQSAAQWCDATAGGAPVRSVLRALARLNSYTGDLDRLPAAVAVEQIRQGIRPGVRYVDGGWGRIVDELRASAERAGARVRTGVTVEAVSSDPHPAVRVGGEARRAAAVVLAGLAPPAVERLTGARVDPGGPPVAAACLDVALERLPVRENAWTLGFDEPLYVSAYSEWSQLAPAGGAVVHVVRYLSTGETAARDELEAALDRVQPGWRDALVHANFLPRMTVAHRLPPLAGGLAERPGVDALGLDGVLVAGDWVGGEGWLADASLASAAQAAAAARQIAGAGDLVAA